MTDREGSTETDIYDGPKGDKGDKGDTGTSITSVETVTVGKEHTIIVHYSDGTSETVGVVRDGATGSGTGDMLMEDYDQNENGVVDAVDQIQTATATFTEALTRANIESGETGGTIFGKIKKFFTDLKPVAFTADYADLTGTPPTQPVDQTYNSASVNAQSGTAVAQAVSPKANSADLSTVATTGSYTDLSNRPSDMAGATASSDGANGFVPAPQAGDEGKYLRGDGLWDTINLVTSWSELTGKPFSTLDNNDFTVSGAGKMSLNSASSKLSDFIKRLYYFYEVDNTGQYWDTGTGQKEDASFEVSSQRWYVMFAEEYNATTGVYRGAQAYLILQPHTNVAPVGALMGTLGTNALSPTYTASSGYSGRGTVSVKTTGATYAATVSVYCFI